MSRGEKEKPIILTMGDPTGVGPEILLKALLTGAFDGISRPLLVAGDPAVLLRAAAVFGAEATVTPEQGLATHRLAVDGRSLAIRALSELAAGQLAYGRPDGACGRAMVAYIEWACDRCLAGEAAAMVTAPINKAAIRAAGSPFPGHTELLASAAAWTRW